MNQSTQSTPPADRQAADSLTAQRMANATAAATAAEQARIARLHVEAANDYRAGQDYRNVNSRREG